MVDPQSFGQWMETLWALPQSVLWPPAYVPVARNNLMAAATAAGIDNCHLVLQQRASRAQALARLPLADLSIDTVCLDANQALVDTLRMGVPALNCTGQNMASRLGGCIVRAAGLAECVVSSPSAIVREVVRLG